MSGGGSPSAPDSRTPEALRALRHDLRTPINHIVGYSELLLEAAEDDPAAAPFTSELARINQAGRTLLALVDELLDDAQARGSGLDIEGLGHRLRTPLSAVIGYVELVQDEAADARAEVLLPDLDRIRGAALHLHELVNAALDIAADRPGTAAAQTALLAPVQMLRADGALDSGTLLVVDDDEANRDLLQRRLARLGYAVLVASSGEAALELVRQHQLDLVLLDVMMPGLDGFDVLRRLKADTALRDLPVVVLSALGQGDDAAQCLLLGADDYLTKPINPVILQARIRGCLERKRLRDRELEYLRRTAFVTGPAAIAHLLVRRYGVACQPAEPDPDTRGSFAEDERALLADLEQAVDWVTLGKGETLLRQGEPSDSVYVLVYGRLNALHEEDDGHRRILGEVHTGETVGEWGLLSGRPRSATVVATRDSYLARIDSQQFERLAEAHPRILTHTTRDVVGRLRQAFSARWTGPSVTTIALLPISPGVPIDTVGRRLAEALVPHGRTLLLDRAHLRDLLGAEGLELLEHEQAAPRTAAWLNDLERQHRFVLYQADAEPTAWTRRCVRQADRVLLLARDGATTQPSALELLLEEPGHALNQTRRELVVIHARPTTHASGTADWLAERRVDAHHHLVLGEDRDVQRLARRLAGRAVGLVLGGGGLRSAAHVGVIRALDEANVPIDVIGGTSAGGFIGAQYAAGVDHRTLLERNTRIWVGGNPLGDYTLPFVSLISGARFVKLLQELFGDLQIEDLWRPFFCVSSNLTRAEIVLHRQGPLWQALRASGSIPGVMPPVLYGEDLLVDGGLLNNLPADVMSDTLEGGPAIAVDLRVKVDMPIAYRFGPSLSGLELLLNRWLRRSSNSIAAPSIVAVLMRSLLLGSVHAGQAQSSRAALTIRPPVGQFGLLDGRAALKMVEIGYQSATEALEAWQRSGGFDAALKPPHLEPA